MVSTVISLASLPPASPFNTQSAVSLAFSALIQNFVVPDSCPSIDLLQNPPFTDVGLTLFDVLKPITALGDGKGYIKGAQFAGSPVQYNAVAATASSLISEEFCVTYLNQNNGPISFKAVTEGNDADKTFTAPFPGKSLSFSGLVVVTITAASGDGCGAFLNADDIAAAIRFGPLLIEVDNFIGAGGKRQLGGS
ncbi:hypothetical protein LTR56_023188 [Elasticomyces elasticus]|nr:hypothetical protein LTR56_023188 [Elasticomyces elasticus]KAK3622851.1 hypothetical protein LTR22_024639 [Elasticomyces elasticus]KAK4891579.1 hypothetical protein LTR49_028658 [Elasticomyces elasticus]KAK5736177.1 hypothetical protein LTS12_026258 [Elasticomyces elasticus]